MSGYASPLLFWVFWACLAKQTQNDTSNRRNFFCLFAGQKSTLPSCFSGEPQFCHIWDWWWNITKNISFHFRLFPRKTNDKIFHKIHKKKKLFGGHFGTFLPKFWQKWIFLEERFFKKKVFKRFSVFRYSNYLPSCQKSEKTIELFLRKTPNW